MAESFSLPMDTIVKCPKCGTSNLRTDIYCRSCETALTEAKQEILSELGIQQKTREKAQPPAAIPFEQQLLAQLKSIELGTQYVQVILTIGLLLLLILVLAVIF
ncbi:MAG: hypothetical protein ACUVT7_04015 [Thermoplasmata archaeon]